MHARILKASKIRMSHFLYHHSVFSIIIPVLFTCTSVHGDQLTEHPLWLSWCLQLQLVLIQLHLHRCGTLRCIWALPRRCVFFILLSEQCFYVVRQISDLVYRNSSSSVLIEENLDYYSQR